MPDKIVIEGIPPYDGEHEFDASYFTMRELHTIKKLTGLRAGELADAIAAGDSDVVIALAVVALGRNGKQPDTDKLWDSQAGRISLVTGDADEDEEAGDAEVPPDGSRSGNSGSSETTSGDGSGTTSASPAAGQEPTGTPASGTSESPPVRLAS